MTRCRKLSISNNNLLVSAKPPLVANYRVFKYDKCFRLDQSGHVYQKKKMVVGMFVLVVVLVMGAAQAQLGRNLLNAGWGNTGLGTLGNNAAAFWGNANRGLGLRSQNSE